MRTRCLRESGGRSAVPAAAARTVDLTALPCFAIGPRRGLLAGSKLPLEYAAPQGDKMLTGCCAPSRKAG